MLSGKCIADESSDISGHLLTVAEACRTHSDESAREGHLQRDLLNKEQSYMKDLLRPWRAADSVSCPYRSGWPACSFFCR